MLHLFSMHEKMSVCQEEGLYKANFFNDSPEDKETAQGLWWGGGVRYTRNNDLMLHVDKKMHLLLYVFCV